MVSLQLDFYELIINVSHINCTSAVFGSRQSYLLFMRHHQFVPLYIKKTYNSGAFKHMQTAFQCPSLGTGSRCIIKVPSNRPLQNTICPKKLKSIGYCIRFTTATDQKYFLRQVLTPQNLQKDAYGNQSSMVFLCMYCRAQVLFTFSIGLQQFGKWQLVTNV